ncbi:MarR family winged helix-turn-helix transcriptional regulator [Aureimonas sp. AU20]|uniref:MarR family winged helix-turn-helix transcriptional regulator n=1 Tax=Aureimonas sp. AU20 TaxID=1349819 RepID=UPI000721E133|nr:MarR family transcriptional regulator [Aureimonas sp. AU20]ALN71653.1 hypothetical protein M673_02950 [Aureimonas sp. AU20]
MFGFLLTDTSRLFRQYFERMVTENGFGLTPGEIRALGYVIRFRGSRQALLAERMGVEPMTLSAYLDRLEGRSLIRRTMDTSDRRAKLIEPTEDAYAVMRELDPLFTRIYQQLTQGLDADEMAVVAQSLEKLRANLTSDPQIKAPFNLIDPSDAATRTDGPC